MNHASLWSKTSTTRQNAKWQLQKFGHLLKWRNYKGNIIDAGCGEGSVTKEILFPVVKNNIQKILAIDKNQEMINFAKQHNQNGEIEYRVMDIMDQTLLNPLENQFDHLFAIHLAHWIPDTRMLLSNFHKILKPGGQIFVMNFADLYVNHVFQQQFKEGRWAKYLPPKPMLTNYTENPTRYISNLLTETGFKVDACDHEKKMIVEENFTDLTRGALTMYEHFERMPPELQEEFLDDHKEKCKQMCTYLGSPDKYELYFEPLTFVATKIT